MNLRNAPDDRSARFRENLNLLPVFVALMRSTVRAGERLGMTQSAVSRALAQLRVWAKDELFIRTATSTEPTRRAMELAGPLSEALTGVQRAFNPEQVGAPAPARIHFALTDYAVLLYQDP